MGKVQGGFQKMTFFSSWKVHGVAADAVDRRRASWPSPALRGGDKAADEAVDLSLSHARARTRSPPYLASPPNQAPPLAVASVHPELP